MEKRINRLDKYLKYKALSDNQVCIICGLSNGLIGKARNGKNDIGLAACTKILEKFSDISKRWLLYGDGEMLASSVSNIVENVGSVGGSITQTTGGSEVINLRLENERLRATLESYRERIEELKEERRDLLNLLKPNNL